jgi:hypothetical protein
MQREEKGRKGRKKKKKKKKYVQNNVIFRDESHLHNLAIPQDMAPNMRTARPPGIN